jgi:hypothetical protein
MNEPPAKATARAFDFIKEQRGIRSAHMQIRSVRAQINYFHRLIRESYLLWRGSLCDNLDC